MKQLNRMINVRFTNEQSIELYEVAKAMQMNTSQLIRYIVMHQLSYLKKQNGIKTLNDELKVMFPD